MALLRVHVRLGFLGGTLLSSGAALAETEIPYVTFEHNPNLTDQCRGASIGEHRARW